MTERETLMGLVPQNDSERLIWARSCIKELKGEVVKAAQEIVRLKEQLEAVKNTDVAKIQHKSRERKKLINKYQEEIRGLRKDKSNLLQEVLTLRNEKK